MRQGMYILQVICLTSLAIMLQKSIKKKKQRTLKIFLTIASSVNLQVVKDGSAISF